MTQEVELNEVEMERVVVLKQIQNRMLTQAQAARMLKISERQVRRLLRRFESGGKPGIKRLPRTGNKGFTAEFKALTMKAVKERYYDFGPSFASEKLLEVEQLRVSRETLRHWMSEAKLWKPGTRKQARIHQSREPRSRFGELVQIDGSHHDWFEGRAPKCCLLVFIDDATRQIVSMRFEPSETTVGYLRCIGDHLARYGKPIAYYSDKHSIFRTTRPYSAEGVLQDTEVHRALTELRIELICANSSQAKGRVERANQTLQDRLIKEMRLSHITGIEAGNAYLPDFMKKYNKRFGIEAKDPQDAHRAVLHDTQALKRILSVHDTRTLTKNLEFSYGNTIYQIQRVGGGYRLRHAKVRLYLHTNGTMEVVHEKEVLVFRMLQKYRRAPIIDAKEINMFVDGLVTTSNAIETGMVCAV